MCIFCKIINKEIPSYCIYEDDLVMAFLDISQVTKGHTLVVPKKHYKNFLECDKKTLSHLMDVAQSLANSLTEKLHAQGMNILTNVNEVAGQTVDHFHVHLIPRYSKDDACVIQFNESEKQDFDYLTGLLKVEKKIN